jgi:hypothetical protein
MVPQIPIYAGKGKEGVIAVFRHAEATAHGGAS